MEVVAPVADFTDKQWLGKQLFFDPSLSQPPGQACAGCHDPAAGWADPNKDSPTSEDSVFRKLMSFDSEIQQPGECQPFFGAAPDGCNGEK